MSHQETKIASPSRQGPVPGPQGLYNPENEHDACGLGFVVNLKNKKSHDIVLKGLLILANLEHRGAVGADPDAGDGCGILLQIPHDFFAALAPALGVTLPAAGDYCVAPVFLPKNATARAELKILLEDIVKAEGQQVLGWRSVPVNPACLGWSVRETEPAVEQIIIGRGAGCKSQDDFELKLFVIRRLMELKVCKEQPNGYEFFYISSMSSRSIVYKGLLLANTLAEYYTDLTDERFTSAFSLVHQRFSTNTFPTWRLAHPFRMICHNGEINTLRGNLNWMAARQATMRSEVIGPDLERLWPLIQEGQSDSACFDNALELLVRGGYSLAHAMMLLIPEAWAGNPLMDDKRRAFYEYHAALMEPWDGPAAVAFTDGRQIGATLDRNGLRPARYIVTTDDEVIMSSEVGVLPVPEDKITHKWRLQPGKMLLIDLEEGRIVSDEEIKTELASAHPYQELLDAGQIRVQGLPDGGVQSAKTNVALLDRQQAFGYTQESWKFLMAPMVLSGQEAIGSMGTDTPVSALSSKLKLLHTYFKQNFAQVTNPPVDAIREELVMKSGVLRRAASQLAGSGGEFDLQTAGHSAARPDQRTAGAYTRHRRGEGQPVPQHHAGHHVVCRSGRFRHGGRC